MKRNNFQKMGFVGATGGVFLLGSIGAGALVNRARAQQSAQGATPKVVRHFQKLRIPELIAGKEFNLSLHPSKKSFWQGATTNTYAYNKEDFWGPTLVFQQGDTVNINVKNELGEPTTTHWHGLHLPAVMDGGPHQLIGAGKTWSPSFVVKNNAGTYWYHPHAHETTQKQLTMGAGGLIIIKDPKEAALALPRTYGVDDIPLALTSRRFYKNDQFSHEGDNDKYGDFLLANGTLDPEATLPAQFVRLRILNAEVERGYNLGFSDNRTFYVIATDGGLVDKPVPVTRMKLMTGERVEILVDLGADKVGSTVNLMSYNSNQPFGYPGGEPGTGRPNGGYLNNLDFRILRINVGVKTAQAITRLPETLVKNTFWKESDVNNQRTLRITADNPGQPFYFDEKPYVMHQPSHVVKLGDVEKWTVTNNRIFGHAFHIHDVQFKIVSRSNGPVEEYEKGWKDTVYVPRDQSVSFIAKFDDYASDTNSFMYHCHMSNHEDGGLMGEFLVVKDKIAFREKQEHPITPQMTLAATQSTGTLAPDFAAADLTGNTLNLKTLSAKKPTVLFFIEANCPCSKDATTFLNRIHKAYGSACNIIGVINAKSDVARAWSKQVGCAFPVIPDAAGKIIQDYAAERSVYTTIIAPGGRIAKTYLGYNQAMLEEITRTVAPNVATKSDPQFTDAPKTLVSGCPFSITLTP
jgi:blue copper oxidase